MNDADNDYEYPIEFIRVAHVFSFENEEDIKQSSNCGCFCCEKVFPASDIGEDDWCDDVNARTALCPHCGIDSVIGDVSGIELTSEFLHEMYLVWFKNCRFDELWS